MNEERLKVLKMLKEGRITMEEAELLLDALGENAEDMRGAPDAEASSQRSRSGEETRHDRSGGRPWHGIPEGIFDFDWKLNPKIFETGFREAMKGLEQTVKEFTKDFKSPEFSGRFKEYFGRSSGQATKDLQIPIAGVEKITIKNRWGDVRISGAETHEVAGTVAITAWAADSETATATAEEITVTHYREDETLIIECEIPESQPRLRFRADLDLSVPRDLGLAVKGMSGDISVSDLRRGVEIATLSGDIIAQRTSGVKTLETKSGDVEVLGCDGEVQAQSMSGDINLEGVRSLSVKARSVSGDIRAEVAPDGDGDFDLTTTSGGVRIKLPSNSRLEVLAETASGRVDCRLPLDIEEQSSGRIQGKLNGGGTIVHLSTKSGNITIAD